MRPNMLAAHIDLILLLTGLATTGALVLCLWPTTTMKLMFGQSPSDALSLLIVRHWGLLVGMVGALLIHAADHAEIRGPTLIVAIVEKAVFALGIFCSPFRRRPIAFVMAAADSSMAVVYLAYLSGL